jgi:hypothetical protein
VTQKRERKPRASADEGAAYTAMVMAEVTRLRLAKTPKWSAERLAEEMAAVGIPWTRDAVVNLENGRRKRLAAHELLALAYVLDVASPVDLLVPATAPKVPVTPDADVATLDALMWCWGQTGPLRAWLAADPAERDAVRIRRVNAADEAVQAAESRRRAARGEF